MIPGSSWKCIWNKSCSWTALLKFWFRTDLGRENSTGFYISMQGGQSLLTFLTLTRWSRSTSNFYVLIGQNLTGDFMRKIYATSWFLFTLTAEADRVLCQLMMFLTVFFPLNIVQNEIQLLSRVFCYSRLVCLSGFCLRNTSLVKVGNPISDGIVFAFHLAWCKSEAILALLHSFQELHLEW